MRFLFSATPAHGPVLALIPLAQAARAAGHEVAFLTGSAFATTVASEVGADVPVLGSGQSFSELVSACVFRSGFRAFTDSDPTSMASLLAGVRVDMGTDAAITAGRSFAPDVVITDSLDFVGPFVASALSVPHVRFKFGPDWPREFARLANEEVAARYSRERLDRQMPMAVIDSTPTALQVTDWSLESSALAFQAGGWPLASNRLALRTEHQQDAARPSRRVQDGADYRWSVLVSLGTVWPDALFLADVIRATEQLPLNAVVTHTGPAWAKIPAKTLNRSYAPFSPFGDLLAGQDLVISAGGAGTVLRTLAAGLPMVLVPRAADQWATALRVEATGAAVIAKTPDDVSQGIRTVMGDPGYLRAARTLQKEMVALPSCSDVIGSVTSQLAATRAHLRLTPDLPISN